MDGLTLTAVVYELSAIVGGRIEKVQQPERDELIISIHAAGGHYRLLASASPENCRLTLTDEKKVSPVEAPAFLMLLRKYLTGARIASVSQINGDRIVRIEIDTYSELRDELRLSIVIEIMGRHSNIILLDGEGVIMDAIRRVSPSVSSARLVLPHIKYELPPSKEKLDPAKAVKEDFLRVLEASQRPDRALAEYFYGLSPAVSAKLLEALGACDNAELADKLCGFYAAMGRGEFFPCVLTANGRSMMTLPFRPADGEEYSYYPTVCEAVNAFYSSRAAEESLKRRTSAYERVIKNAQAKLEKKMTIFSEAISGEEENEKLRLYGELITANLHSIPQRSGSAVVRNYYSENADLIEIPLDPRLSPADNAQRYYSKYRKAKLTREHALGAYKAASDELSYLEELLYTLSCCEGESELMEIKQELIAGGYLRDETHKKGAAKGKASVKLPASKPYAFVSRDGIDILVGKNNRQNDRLTLSVAAPEDTWLHVKDAHGSHVIIKKGSSVPDATLFDAAVLAAWYSKARGSGNVPVDYTLAKYVKKPSGAKPGMVIYTHQHTVYVTPDEEHVRMLAKNTK